MSEECRDVSNGPVGTQQAPGPTEVVSCGITRLPRPRTREAATRVCNPGSWRRSALEGFRAARRIRNACACWGDLSSTACSNPVRGEEREEGVGDMRGWIYPSSLHEDQSSVDRQSLMALGQGWMRLACRT